MCSPLVCNCFTPALNAAANYVRIAANARRHMHVNPIENGHWTNATNLQKPAQPAAATPKQPITKSFEAARERTQAVRAKVRSSLTGLTPHENIYNLPNFLTLTRLVAAPATAYLVLHDQHTLALGLFAYAGITDLIDGWMARKWKLQTVAGSVMDPMADKALMIIVTVTLAVKGAIPRKAAAMAPL